MRIDISIKSSYFSIKLIMLCYLLALFAIYKTMLPPIFKLVILGFLIACTYDLIKKTMLCSNQSIKCIRYFDNQWLIKINNRWLPAILIEHVITNYFICLKYTTNNKNRLVVLFVDSISKAEMHSLKQALFLRVCL